jgi:hypothetical protein
MRIFELLNMSANMHYRERRNRYFGLVFFVLIAGFLIWWDLIGDPGEVIDSSSVSATISEVYDKVYVVVLNDGRKVRIGGNGSLPTSATINLEYQVYEDKSEHFLYRGEY